MRVVAETVFVVAHLLAIVFSRSDGVLCGALTKPSYNWEMARSRFENALEVVSLLAVAAAIAVVAGSWGVLPDRVPSHFGATGHPDAYGSKGNVLIPVGLAVGLYLLFSLVQRLPRRFYNYPVQITASNADVQYRLAREGLASIKAVLSVLVASGTWLTTQVALGQRNGLGSWFVPAVLLSVLLLAASYARAAYRKRNA